MNNLKLISLIIAIFLLLLFLTGCSEGVNNVDTEVLDEDVIYDETETETDSDLAVKNIARRGESDRLPGSLKWGSISIYKSGEDFLKDHTEGLKAVASYSIEANQSETKTSGTTSVTTESSSTTKTTTSESGEKSSSSSSTVTSDGGSTIIINDSTGPVTTKGTITGTGSITQSTTITYD